MFISSRNCFERCRIISSLKSREHSWIIRLCGSFYCGWKKKALQSFLKLLSSCHIREAEEGTGSYFHFLNIYTSLKWKHAFPSAGMLLLFCPIPSEFFLKDLKSASLQIKEIKRKLSRNTFPFCNSLMSGHCDYIWNITKVKIHSSGNGVYKILIIPAAHPCWFLHCGSWRRDSATLWKDVNLSECFTGLTHWDFTSTFNKACRSVLVCLCWGDVFTSVCVLAWCELGCNYHPHC